MSTRAAAPPPPPDAAGGAASDTDASMQQAIEKLAALVSADATNPDTQAAIRGVAKKLRVGEEGASMSGSDDDDASSVGSRSSAGSSYSGSSRSSRSGSVSSYSSGGSRSYSGSSASGTRSYSSGSRSPSPSRGHRDRSMGRSVATSVMSGSSRPTPYQLWKASHIVEVPAKPVTTLTRKEEKRVVNRLTDTSRQRHARLMREQSRRLGELMGGLSFTPSICAKSREYSQTVESLEARLPELQKKKKNKLDKLRTKESEAEMTKAPFQPDMKTPCVCSVGVGLKESRELGLVEDHTAYCLKFMSACDTINTRNEHQVMGSRMRRKVAHLSQYDEYKRIRAQQRRQIMEEVESRELTFAPQINSNSAAMAARFKAKQAARARAKKAAKAAAMSSPSSARTLPSNRDPGHEQETFTPRINSRSKRIKGRVGKRAEAVFDRLYNSGRSKLRSRNLESRAANAAARGELEESEMMLEAAEAAAEAAVRVAVGEDVDVASVASSAYSRVSRAFNPASPRKTSALAKGPRAFNTVVFDSQKHGFIVSRLHRQAHAVHAAM